jgi:hypothetical protein
MRITSGISQIADDVYNTVWLATLFSPHQPNSQEVCMQRNSAFPLFFQTGLAMIGFLLFASLYSWAVPPVAQAPHPAHPIHAVAAP